MRRRPTDAAPAVVVAVVEPAVDADVVVLLLLHRAVVARLGEAEVVVGHPLLRPPSSPGGGNGNGVQLAARAVRAVQVGRDQIWSKALLEEGRQKRN